jgi:hypothetical protein
MQEPSDGIVEELERQLQLALAAAAIAARRAIAVRQQSIEQAPRGSEQAARGGQGADRRRAAYSRPSAHGRCSTPAGGRPQRRKISRTCGRKPTAGEILTSRDVADDLRSRCRPDSPGAARSRRSRPDQVIALAAVQEVEYEHQAARAEPVNRPTEEQISGPDVTTARGFDDPQRREQLRTQLVAAGVPEPAIEARTLADLGQAHPAAEAAQTPVAVAPASRAASARSAGRQLHRQR